MKTVIGLDGVDGFPCQLSPLKTKIVLSIPAVELTKHQASRKSSTTR